MRLLESARRQTGSPAKNSEKMVQAGETRLGSYIGDRVRGCLQKPLRMADPDPKDLVKNCALQFVPKRPFQSSPWYSTVSDNVADRQIDSAKIVSDVVKRVPDVRIFDGEDVGALSCYNSLWRDSFWANWRRLAIHETIEQSCGLVCHAFEIVSNAGKRYLHAIANYRVVVDA